MKKNKVKTDPQSYFFKYFSIGAITFLLGLGSVLYVNLLLPPSPQQEVLALIGLILSVPGGLLAFYCYIRLLLSRLQHFMEK